MTCPSCSSENRPESRFCRSCGSALLPSSTESRTLPLSQEPAAYAEPTQPAAYAEPTQPTAYFSQNVNDPGTSPYYAPPAVNYNPPLPPSPSARAITALVLSVMSFVMCPILSIPGFILGKLESNAINRGEAPQAGKGYALAGFWIGLVSTVIWGLGGILGLMGLLGAVLSSVHINVN